MERRRVQRLKLLLSRAEACALCQEGRPRRPRRPQELSAGGITSVSLLAFFKRGFFGTELHMSFVVSCRVFEATLLVGDSSGRLAAWPWPRLQPQRGAGAVCAVCTDVDVMLRMTR